ncbi:MAG: hypothetical protein ACTSRG_23270 [Candidatus Helarchaeota archaeon]
MYSYARGTRSRSTPVSKFLVIVLSNIETYKNYVKRFRFISMKGRYIEEQELKKILQEAF